jgi:hypothetical protein
VENRPGVEIISCPLVSPHLAADSTVREGLVLGYRVRMPGGASSARDLPGAMGDLRRRLPTPASLVARLWPTATGIFREE